MNSKERVLNREREKGRAAALALAERASELTGTELISAENDIPAWNENAVYTTNHIGYPVQDNGQVYIILQAHTPSHNPGVRPVDLPAIYSITHTKDAKRAKPYTAPNGTSGLYMKDEVCTKDGQTWKSTQDNNPYPPNETGTSDFWEVVTDA
jgi:hypothetical protein